MKLFLVGLANLVMISLVIQLVASKETERILIPLCKVAIGLWILQFVLQFAGHKIG